MIQDEFENLPFEEALEKLEEIANELEAGDLPLEESLALYEIGQKLAAYCNDLLNKASLRVEQLTSDGEIIDISNQE